MVFPGAFAALADDQPVQLESEVETKRAERRIVADAESRAAADAAEVEVVHPRKHIASVEERDDRKISVDVRERATKFGVQDDHRVPADRQARGWIDDAARYTVRIEDAQSIQGEAAHGGAPAGEEALAD